MFHIIYNFIFLIATIIILIRTISYSLYEIKCQDNKSGGVTIIVFSTLIVIFANIVVWSRH